jgi:hypothetical protein
MTLNPDGGSGSVAGNYGDVVGKGEEALVDRGEELRGIASGKVGAAYGTGEESVAGEEEGLVREVEADAAFGVAGGVEDGAGEARSTALGGGFDGSDGDELAVVEGVVGGGDGGGGDAEPAGLNVHHFDQGEVALVVEDGGAGELLEAVSAGDVVDVGVGDDDLLDGERVFGEEGCDAGDLVAGVDDDGFAGDLVTEDGAVALERADGDDFVDHGFLRVMVKGGRLRTDLHGSGLGFWFGLCWGTRKEDADPAFDFAQGRVFGDDRKKDNDRKKGNDSSDGGDNGNRAYVEA